MSSRKEEEYKELLVELADSAREVLTYAEEEAVGRNATMITTEHVLLALTREEIGKEALKSAGIPQTLPLSPRMTAVIRDYAIPEAKRSIYPQVTSVHLLRAIVRDGESLASGILYSIIPGLEKSNLDQKIPNPLVRFPESHP